MLSMTWNLELTSDGRTYPAFIGRAGPGLMDSDTDPGPGGSSPERGDDQ